MHHVLLSIDSPGRVTGHYDLSLVVLSVIIAIIASYATLDLASRVRLVEKLRFVWFACGAIAMGAGIWAMHYIGMAAYRLPVAVLYDLPTVAASLLAAILASAVALGAVSRPPLTRTRSIIGSLAMGTGIASMHYIGMAAMRMPAMCVYSLPIVTLSVLLAVLISFGALQIAFQFRNDNSLSWRKLGAAVILGLAIPIMHYVGMAAATFISLPQVRGNANSAVGSTSLGLFSISFVTVAMLGVVILQAASGRKLAFKEQELASKFLQTQIIFDSLSEGILVLDRNRNIVQINHSAKKMLGFLDSDLSHTEIAAAYQISLPNGDPLPPESWPSALALRGEFLQNCELNITRSDHTKSILGEISTAPVLGPDGQLLQIIVSYRDVTKPREIDEARLRLAAIVESSEDAIIGKDGDGIVKSWNGGAEKLFGYTAQEMIGTSVRLLLPLDRLEEEEDILARIKRGEIVDHIETIRRRKNGQFINVSLTISPIRDSSGKVVGASKIVRNITEKKMMESRLFLSQKMEAIGQLTGGVAHDFNNLLGVIIGNLDLLERRLTADEISLKRVHTAQKAATRGAELTRRMLAFSSREQLHPKPIPIEDPVQATIELATRGLGPEIEIVTHFDHGIPPVMVDAGGLENALLNILVNARDAMPHGGQITITTQRALLGKEHGNIELDGVQPGHYASITISDSGEGMTREILERAFEPFYTTKLPGKGTGIGLATVYGFFKQSGGTVHLYSEPGYGTTVSCYLPIAVSGDIPPQENSYLDPEEAVLCHETILLVDDEVELLEIASTYLDDLGYIVLCATSGPEALALVDRHPEIDLLVTDVIMPGGMNGAELAQEACSRVQKLRVIYASGFPADALADRNMSMANGPLLRKPYQRSELVSLIRTTLTNKIATSQNSASPVT